MPNLFSALNISSNALSVNERAISVVSHNVANMNTEGYHKQRVNLATRNIAGGIGDNVAAQIRSDGGVMIANVMRYNNNYLNNYYRTQNSKLSELEQQLGNLGDLAAIFNDLDGEGIDGVLSDFYKAVNNLHEYPASSTARTNFIESARNLCSMMNSKSVQLDEMTANALGNGLSRDALESSKIYYQIENFNDKLEELAAVNKALQVTQTGTLTANNLLDRRDMILKDLSQFVDFRAVEKQNGTVNLYIGDTCLVKGSAVKGKLDIQTTTEYLRNNGLALPDEWYNSDGSVKSPSEYCEAQGLTYPDDFLDATGNVMTVQAYCEANGITYPSNYYDENGDFKLTAVVNIVGENNTTLVSDANSVIQGGALGGMLHSTDLNGEGLNVGKVQSTLNKLAETLAGVFNDLNTRSGAYCINPDDTSELRATWAGNNIFSASDGSNVITAGNISIDSALLGDRGIWNIACAYFDDMDNFDSRAVGNGQNAAAMLNTKDEKLMAADGSYLLGGVSISEYYTSLLGEVASAGSNTKTLYDTQNDIVQSIENQLQGSYGVDLNEELVDLVKYQTAYSASAQVFNICNNCLNTLLSLGG